MGDFRGIPRNIKAYSVAQQQPQGETHNAWDRPPTGFPRIDGLTSDPKLAGKFRLVEAEQAADNPHLLARLLRSTCLPPCLLGCRRASVRADRYSDFLVLIGIFFHDKRISHSSDQHNGRKSLHA
jgi:hypothetical protein